MAKSTIRVRRRGDLSTALKVAAGQSCARLARTLVENLYNATPVDTGYARSRWVASAGAPGGGAVGHANAKQSGVDRDRVKPSSMATPGSGMAWLDSYALSGKIYIANDAPYIGRLNAGWSSQAPSGFVETAIAMAMSLFGRGRGARR